MVETDWREILSFSQRELMETDKEKLCESLSWMEADDIELNFTDLKTLFRLAQDILKFKSEQVNNLHGKLETFQRKSSKIRTSTIESPTRSMDSVLDTINHQEEVIKANKEILEQLCNEIAELEKHKSNVEADDTDHLERESESSRDALSELNAIAEFQNQITSKNRHIRKLLGDVKVLEEENTKMKEKVSILKDKLSEATQIIENLTEQILSINKENSRLKEILAKSEESKALLTVDIEILRQELIEKESSKDNVYDEIKSKLQHWKNVARSKKTELQNLFSENTKLKEELAQVASQPFASPKVKKNQEEEEKIQELQEKLSEAANQIIESADLINNLKEENKQLKASTEEVLECSLSDARNESDDGKERILINKLKRKLETVTLALQRSEVMVAEREKELTEISSELQLLKTDEGLNALLEGIKNKKHQLKVKDEGIKLLVKEVNSYSELANDLQLENEIMRQKLNLPSNKKIPTKGIVKKYHDMDQILSEMENKFRKTENKLVSLELEKRHLLTVISKLSSLLLNAGYSLERIEEIRQLDDHQPNMPCDGGGEGSIVLAKLSTDQINTNNANVQAIMEENEGLRKGLEEILDFLKDNSTTSSGVLALQCPSLEAMLKIMEARHMAGWFAPHMAATLEFKEAVGGKSALLAALHDARRETYEVMSQLTQELNKSQSLEKQLSQAVSSKEQQTDIDEYDSNIAKKFGTWIFDEEKTNIDFCDGEQIKNFIAKGNAIHETQLKNGLSYFYTKYKALSDKITLIAIKAADEQNKWAVQEEQSKAEIVNLKSQLDQAGYNDDFSETSSGSVVVPNIEYYQRKCSYLEESYKFIRTLNENIKNEYLESKKESMLTITEQEVQIQSMILSVVNLTDKLRRSVPLDLFWSQNEILNESVTQYRKVTEICIKYKEPQDLFKNLEKYKIDLIDNVHSELQNKQFNDQAVSKTYADKLSKVEQSILTKQLEEICLELEQKNRQLKNLEAKLLESQENQSKLIDKTMASFTIVEQDLLKEQMQKLGEVNYILKEKCQHLDSQLDIALTQLQDQEQRHMSTDMEINLLRHQILDLQAIGDNKAIMTRLSGEVLVAHLQALDNQKKIESMNLALNKEKQLRYEAEEMLHTRQKIFDVYCYRFESKFRYMFEVMQVLRRQYQGSAPLVSVEKYLDNMENVSRRAHEYNIKLDEIEDLRSSLMTKYSVYYQVLQMNKNNCSDDENSCQHKLQIWILKGIHSRELEHCTKKNAILEQSRQEIFKRCNHLEKTLVLVNQGFEMTGSVDKFDNKGSIVKNQNLEVVDVESDNENSSSINKSRTVTLPYPSVLKKCEENFEITKITKQHVPYSLDKFQDRNLKILQGVNVSVQTDVVKITNKSTQIQTDINDNANADLNQKYNVLFKKIETQRTHLRDAKNKIQEREANNVDLNAEKNKLKSSVMILTERQSQSDKLNESLRLTIQDLRQQLNDAQNISTTEKNKKEEVIIEENKYLLVALKKLEADKNTVVTEYKDLLNKEREEYAQAMRDLNIKYMELQTKFDRLGSDSNNETLREAVSKFTAKIADLEDKCFKLQSERDGCQVELTAYQSEIQRWKDLAKERLAKMEQLNSQLEQRHCQEVQSYKEENDHWMTQLNETQHDNLEFRSRITEQKTSFIKQLANKDAQIDELKSIVHTLKTQVMNMHTMLSGVDPSFDLSAIVEVEEVSDGSQTVTDRLELKFHSSSDLNEIHDDMLRTPATSSALWQEPVVERLRQEKQLTTKQNSILRRQIKSLAARERRARLEAQNLRNQVYRISTMGSRGSTVEMTTLHGKIVSLQEQLISARRDSQSTVALWDKCKRAQQDSERWQARYEEKCRETKKLEANLGLAKSSIARLEREKRLLLSRLSELRNERNFAIEKHDHEQSEKNRVASEFNYVASAPPAPVCERALINRIQAQQRRIAALETAVKGNEHLVSEYERALAEITSLKGQVLKLESTILESQIRSPFSCTNKDQKSDLEYWKSYCEMLKEENVLLNLRVNSLETVPSTASHRVNDLEQTVLTLRGLVSKLQSEQKNSSASKRPESRPISNRSCTDKSRSQLESYRIEITNLKRTIQDKDDLLERSKEMLKIAAEREDELLAENSALHAQLHELRNQEKGFLSA